MLQFAQDGVVGTRKSRSSFFKALHGRTKEALRIMSKATHMVGAAQDPMLGTFKYFGKPDVKHSATSAAVACVVHMFVMHVAEELATWPEHSERQRVWVRSCILSSLCCLQ